MKDNLDIQGHRGCRGLLPENTTPAFLKAVDLGVNTLELDLVITADDVVLISHEPYFNHKISTAPDGSRIKERDEKKHNIYQLTYDEVKKYDVGLAYHDDFPDQQKIKIHKPSLRDMVEAVEEKMKDTDKAGTMLYNVEIKRKPEMDGEFHPDVRTYTRLVLDEVNDLCIQDRTIIQSFDPEALRIVRELDPRQKTALLIANKKSFEKNIRLLGFKPDIYSPYYELVSEKLVEQCKKEGITLLPWTVNEAKDIEDIILKGVDGIISDYPDRVIQIYKRLQSKNDQIKY